MARKKKRGGGRGKLPQTLADVRKNASRLRRRVKRLETVVKSMQLKKIERVETEGVKMLDRAFSYVDSYCRKIEAEIEEMDDE